MGFFFLCFIFFLLFLLISMFFSYLTKMEKESMTSFECGMEYKNNNRSPFSIRFFLLIILFIVFDVEMLLLIHFPWSLFFSFLKSSFVSIIFFLCFFFILFLGTLFEKKQGALSWQF